MGQTCAPSAWAVCQPTVPQPHGLSQFPVLVLQQSFLWVCFFPLHINPLYPLTHLSAFNLIVNSSWTSQHRPNSAVIAPHTYSSFLRFIRVFFFLFACRTRNTFFICSFLALKYSSVTSLDSAIVINYHTTATNRFMGFLCLSALQRPTHSSGFLLPSTLIRLFGAQHKGPLPT